ncbi:MAG TPA: DsbA family oxidoreductase [Chitinophagaceae bacterium]|nr:DsbA family oxidoreductase [Chitinophagaceae bacterium]
MKVEIWSDVTCTHCYTAKRKFERALSQFKNRDKIEVIWRSFELAPGLKTDPNKFLPQFLQELQGISLEQAQDMIDRVTDSVKEVGLEYNLNKAIPANSFNAHRLSHFAEARGLQDKMEERIFSAYFSEGKNIDDIATLILLAKEIGLNASDVKNIFETAEYADQVNQDLAEAKQIGITSVPKYIFNANTKVSGTQDSDVYLEILEKEFAQWKADKAKIASEIINGESCKIGEDCK